MDVISYALAKKAAGSPEYTDVKNNPGGYTVHHDAVQIRTSEISWTEGSYKGYYPYSGNLTISDFKDADGNQWLEDGSNWPDTFTYICPDGVEFIFEKSTDISSSFKFLGNVFYCNTSSNINSSNTEEKLIRYTGFGFDQESKQIVLEKYCGWEPEGSKLISHGNGYILISNQEAYDEITSINQKYIPTRTQAWISKIEIGDSLDDITITSEDKNIACDTYTFTDDNGNVILGVEVWSENCHYPFLQDANIGFTYTDKNENIILEGNSINLEDVFVGGYSSSEITSDKFRGYVYGCLWGKSLDCLDFEFFSNNGAKSDYYNTTLNILNCEVGSPDEQVGLGYHDLSSNGVSIGYGLASGQNSTAIGYNATASGNYSAAIGYNTTASAEGSTSVGTDTTASGSYSFASGCGTTASGTESTALNWVTTASGDASTAMGTAGIASGNNSIVSGRSCEASAQNAIATGGWSIASNINSATFGFQTRADNQNMIACGKYNAYGDSNILFAVGNGTSDTARSNAFAVYSDGTVSIGGESLIDIINSKIGDVENGAY